MPNTSSIELKKKYRKLILKFHPDKNQLDDAKQKFIEVTDAYQFIKTYHELYGPYIHAEAYNVDKSFYNEANHKSKMYQNMTYDELNDTEFSSFTDAILIIGEYGLLFFEIATLCILPISILLLFHLKGLIVYMFILILTLPIHVPIIRELIQNPPSGFGMACNSILNNRYTYFIVALIYNLYVYAFIVIQTLITLWETIALYALIIIIGSVAFYFGYFKTKTKLTFKLKWFSSFLITLSCLHVLFCVNFYFTNNAQEECYTFVNQKVYNRSTSLYYRKQRASSLIYLQDNAYASYPGIRIFKNYDEMLIDEAICYVFEDGLLGLRVMKSYEFVYREDLNYIKKKE